MALPRENDEQDIHPGIPPPNQDQAHHGAPIILATCPTAVLVPTAACFNSVYWYHGVAAAVGRSGVSWLVGHIGYRAPVSLYKLYVAYSSSYSNCKGPNTVYWCRTAPALTYLKGTTIPGKHPWKTGGELTPCFKFLVAVRR
jgi:hypothetical protein